MIFAQGKKCNKFYKVQQIINISAVSDGLQASILKLYRMHKNSTSNLSMLLKLQEKGKHSEN